MKRSTLAAVAVACALSATITVSVPVAADESDNMCAQIFVEISQPGVCVSEKDGVVTLSGIVESQLDRKAAERAALKHDGVTEVRNLISVSN